MHSLSMVGQMAAMAGTIDSGNGPEAELGHGHESAGIAGRHDGIGVAVADRFQREPHARLPPALAQGLARLGIHGHRHVGMDQLRLGGERRMGGQLGLDAGFVANQDEPHVRVADQRNRGSGNDHARSVVPAHGVERDGDWSTHFSLPIRMDSVYAAGRPRGNPRKTRIDLKRGQ